MSRIATQSLFGYSLYFPKGAILSISAFQRNQFLQAFLHQKIHFLQLHTFFFQFSHHFNVKPMLFTILQKMFDSFREVRSQIIYIYMNFLLLILLTHFGRLGHKLYMNLLLLLLLYLLLLFLLLLLMAHDMT